MIVNSLSICFMLCSKYVKTDAASTTSVPNFTKAPSPREKATFLRTRNRVSAILAPLPKNYLLLAAYTATILLSKLPDVCNHLEQIQMKVTNNSIIFEIQKTSHDIKRLCTKENRGHKHGQ
ncbi:Os06g0698822 [Oryza sativa Japonica Group]|uniref:Os06g0698822 protein n=2 Tax=Oryza sativa subsp. japonica TaxID=39947 RepID=C7J425_ORYSJ|nr:hypothetical protein EE612_036283 [Oryza sativa]BAH93706.1 Os06g0698822 [Oryza sativa Japonica Group]BAS99318.1 Os06g0698822 [Oryza sativa Japonica Group]|eukprot:NP_001174978.1 Os06g0698822 [Oryza sativa Japonica Group]